ncbi:MAG: FMN phosphatase YigB (HAD superfamily) [Candidatus Endobugula sp.]|jgi:FMN phosphatase YigB (HAD superfamily)
MMINWNKIDTVLLDMDGTLLDLHYDNYFWSTYLPMRYAAIKGIPLALAQAHLHEHIQSLDGTLNWYCLDYWSDTLALDVGKLKAENDVAHKITERPYTEAFLQFLHKQKKHVILVTNAHPIGLTMKLNATCIQAYLHRTISSHQFNTPKEEQLFWQRLSAHLLTTDNGEASNYTFDPQTTLFIDDNARILAAAEEYGIAHTIGIHQPDSHVHRELTIPNAIHHFSEIMPDTQQ